MKYVILFMREKLLKAARACARAHHSTFKALIRNCAERTEKPDRRAASLELLRLMAERTGDSQGWKWSRVDLHER